MSGAHESRRQIVILHVDAVEHELEAPEQPENGPIIQSDHENGSMRGWTELLDSAAVFCDVLFDFESDNGSSSSTFMKPNPPSVAVGKSPSLDESQRNDEFVEHRHHELRRHLLGDVQQNVRIIRNTAVHHCGSPLRWPVFHVSERVRSMSLTNCNFVVPMKNGSASMTPFTENFTVPTAVMPNLLEWDSSVDAPIHLYTQADMAHAKEMYFEAVSSTVNSNQTDSSRMEDDGAATETLADADRQILDTTVTIVPELLDEAETLFEKEKSPSCPALDDTRSFDNLWQANFNSTLLAHRFRVDLDHSALFRNNMELLMKQEMRDINIVLSILGIIALGSVALLLWTAYTGVRDRKQPFNGRPSSSNTKANRSTKDVLEGFTVGNSSFHDATCRYLPLSPNTNGTISPMSQDGLTRVTSRDIPTVSPEPMSPDSKRHANWWGNRATRRQNRDRRSVPALLSSHDGNETTVDSIGRTELHGSVQQRFFLRPISPILSPNESFSSECVHEPPLLVNDLMVNICPITPPTSVCELPSIRPTSIEASRASETTIECTPKLNDTPEQCRGDTPTTQPTTLTSSCKKGDSQLCACRAQATAFVC